MRRWGRALVSVLWVLCIVEGMKTTIVSVIGNEQEDGLLLNNEHERVLWRGSKSQSVDDERDHLMMTAKGRGRSKTQEAGPLLLQGDAVQVAVTSLLDEVVNTSACAPSSSDLCTFRSALLYCSELLVPSAGVSSCVVNLPTGSNNVIYMNPLLGEISLAKELTLDNMLEGTLTIVGNDCTIAPDVTGVNALELTSRLLHVALPSLDNDFTLNMENFTIYNFGNNTLEGSGLYLVNLARSSLRHMTFNNNTGSNGGAVYIHSSTNVDFQSCIFNNNSASIYGGGVFVLEDSLKITFSNCSFFGNFAVEDGGKLS